MSDDKSQDLVKVNIDVFVPKEFVGHDLIEIDTSGREANVSAWCRMDSGRLTLRGLVFDPPLDAREMAHVDWAPLCDRLVYDAGLAQRLRTATESEGVDDEFLDRLEDAARDQRAYNRMTFADYERVLSLAADGGPDAVSRAFHVGRRQANRYIRDAKGKVQQ